MSKRLSFLFAIVCSLSLFVLGCGAPIDPGQGNNPDPNKPGNGKVVETKHELKVSIAAGPAKIVIDEEIRKDVAEPGIQTFKFDTSLPTKIMVSLNKKNKLSLQDLKGPVYLEGRSKVDFPDLAIQADSYAGFTKCNVSMVGSGVDLGQCKVKFTLNQDQNKILVSIGNSGIELKSYVRDNQDGITEFSSIYPDEKIQVTKVSDSEIHIIHTHPGVMNSVTSEKYVLTK